MMLQFVVWKVRGDSPYSTRRQLMLISPDQYSVMYGFHRLIKILED